MGRIRRWVGSLICRLRGHDWYQRPLDPLLELARGTFWRCRRCPATRWVQSLPEHPRCKCALPLETPRGESHRVQFFGMIAGSPGIDRDGNIRVTIQTSWKDALGKLEMLKNRMGLFTIELEMPRAEREGDWIPPSTWRRAGGLGVPPGQIFVVPADYTLGDVMADLCYPERGEEDAET